MKAYFQYGLYMDTPSVLMIVGAGRVWVQTFPDLSLQEAVKMLLRESVLCGITELRVDATGTGAGLFNMLWQLRSLQPFDKVRLTSMVHGRPDPR